MIFRRFIYSRNVVSNAACIKQQTFRKAPSNTANVFLYFQFNTPHFDSAQRYCDCYRKL